MEVYLGEERICSRLIAYRAPGHVINERRRKAKRAVQKSGKTLSREYLEWLDYSFYITNVGAEIWSPEVVGTIYRIRWQIELVFKQWKQLFRMDVMRGTREERIRCLLYGRLIMICIVTRIYALSAWYCHSTMCREVSGVKLIQWLQRKGRLSRAIADNMLPALMEELLKSFPKGLLKQKRRRKTTLELISGQVGFLEGFSL
ncbi:MAG: Mobile element protein [Candidatus Jettenia ecosi]|nr:MAG: Mobile element protein [Candidatus Jettenia ecosi]